MKHAMPTGTMAVRSWAARTFVTLMLGLGLAGCATTNPGASPMPTGAPPSAAKPARPAPVSPMPGTKPEPRPSPAAPTNVGTTASGGNIASNGTAPAVTDSLPSADAQAVLATIPEPLKPEERVAPPARGTMPPPAAAASAPDTASVADSTAAPGEEGASDVPVPAPVQPLGDRQGGAGREPVIPDSVLVPTKPAAPPATATGDSCWRVQLGAPPEKDKAESLKAAAESQLLVAIVIEQEKGRYKVRTRDCLASAAAADQLKRRAIVSGFEGAFRFVTRKK